MHTPQTPGGPSENASLAGRVLVPVQAGVRRCGSFRPARRRWVLAGASACGAFLIVLLMWANWPGVPLAEGARVDRIVVWKSRRKLELFARQKLLKTYSVSLGRNPVGPKRREGDKRTPEGLYTIESHNPRSSFHRALKISYPSASDREAAAKQGVSPGSNIMIHGIRNGLGLIGRFHRQVDWTSGCIAVTDAEIDEVYRAVPDGTPVEIHP